MDKTKRTHRFRYVLAFGGRWWIRFAAAKPRRFEQSTELFLRAGFRTRRK